MQSRGETEGRRAVACAKTPCDAAPSWISVGLLPGYLRIDASLDSDQSSRSASEFCMMRLKQILTNQRQFQLPAEVPAESCVHCAVTVHALCPQGAYVAVRRIKLKPLGQIEKGLGGGHIVGSRSLVR